MRAFRRLGRAPAKTRHNRGHPLERAGSALRLTRPTAIRRSTFAARPLAALLLTLVLSLSPAEAVEPGEMLKDPALEARARRLSQELRCVVCQNQSIDDSNAPLAHDLRVIVRERLSAGDTDAQVLSYVEARYGAFVLLRPRLTPRTVLLWATPLVLLAGAAAYLWRVRRRRPGGPAQAAALTAEEQRELEELLHRGPQS
jgi:cytochrome c-type biogenesis protein CcmH